MIPDICRFELASISARRLLAALSTSAVLETTSERPSETQLQTRLTNRKAEVLKC
jgi:hypothetical protein